MTFDIEKILNVTDLGICLTIGDDTVWVPKKHCEWTEFTITMRRSVAEQNFVI